MNIVESTTILLFLKQINKYIVCRKFRAFIDVIRGHFQPRETKMEIEHYNTNNDNKPKLHEIQSRENIFEIQSEIY